MPPGRSRKGGLPQRNISYTQGGEIGTKLERMSQMSQENPDMVFTSIGHLINKELLKDCHKK